jgi:hypothetical protein
MGLPTRHSAQFGFLLHILKERYDPAELRDDGRRQAGEVVIDNEATQAPVDHVSNSHTESY